MTKGSENINWTLLVVVILLTIIGLANLYSALNIWGESGNVRLFWLQIAWSFVGILFLLATSFIDYRIFERLAYPIYIIVIILLALTIVAGRKVSGHKSWLGFGGFGIQPSEFAKIAMIFVLAKYFTNNPRPDGFNFLDLIKPFILTIIPTGIIIMQGDAGSTLYLVLLFASFAWFAKIKKSVIIVILALGILTSVLGYQYVLTGHQKARITTFLNPDYDVKGSGYHVTQSRIAVGSGKIWGKGYLKGNINKLKYLPEKHTDFIFPVLAEEWGFAGSMVMLILYYILLAVTLEIARQSRDRFGIFVAIGVGAYLFLQITINLGGVLGLMPLTGITLPFLSYGGSATLSLFAVIGVLNSIYKKRFVF